MVRMQTVGSVVASLVALAGSVTVAANPAPAAPRVIAMTDLKELGAVTPGLAAKRVVFIGEQHDRYDHHLNQLAIIEAIHAPRKSRDRNGDVSAFGSGCARCLYCATNRRK
jgi:uncharacterized iron-regulated protein